MRGPASGPPWALEVHIADVMTVGDLLTLDVLPPWFEGSLAETGYRAPRFPPWACCSTLSFILSRLEAVGRWLLFGPPPPAAGAGY